MSSKWKKSLCILLCMSICCGLAVMSVGATNTETKNEWVLTKSSNDEGISPYWIQIKKVFVTLDFENGQAYAAATAYPKYGGVQTVVFVELLNTYGTCIASKTSSGWTTEGVQAELYHPVQSGQVYQVRTTVTIKDSQGAVLETMTETSDGKIAP